MEQSDIIVESSVKTHGEHKWFYGVALNTRMAENLLLRRIVSCITCIEKNCMTKSIVASYITCIEKNCITRSIVASSRI